MIFKGPERPQALLIHEVPTTERNGVLVSVELVDGWNEKRIFEQAIKTQLPYLSNVYFDIEGFDNTYNIIQNDLFMWNTLMPVNELHICLKGIYYPIDWSALGIKRIYLSVALRIDDYDVLQPVFNREELIWNNASKELIKAKAMEVYNFFVNAYNTNRPSIEYSEIAEKIDSLNPEKTLYVTLEEEDFDITQMVKDYESNQSLAQVLPIKVNGLNFLTSRFIYKHQRELVDNYEPIAEIDRFCNWRAGKVLRYVDFWTSIKNKNSYEKYIVSDYVPSRKEKSFLMDTLSNVLFVRQKNSWHNRRRLTWYHKNLNLGKFSKSDWRAVIKEWQGIEEQFLNKMDKIENYPITAEWEEEKKEERKARNNGVLRTFAKKEQVRLYSIRRGATTRVDWVLEKGIVTDIADLEKDGLVLYGDESYIAELGKMSTFYGVYTAYVLIERDIARLEAAKPSNWITYDEFMKGNTKHFQEYCLHFHAKNLLGHLYGNKNTFLTASDEAHVTDLKLLNSYISEKSMEGFKYKDTLMEVAKSLNFWNNPMIAAYERCEKRIESELLDFLKCIRMHEDEAMDLAKEIYRFKKSQPQSTYLSARYI